MKNLPCPFCGHPLTSFQVNQGMERGKVECFECGGSGPEVRTDYDISPNAAWHEDAIKEWNTRSDYSSVELEKINMILDEIGCNISGSVYDKMKWLVNSISTLQRVIIDQHEKIELLTQEKVDK